ncbi:MAG: hypothetical protein ACRDRL_26800, partial [Sciscionella sp.]
MRIIRRPILVFGAVLAAVALTACSTGPRQQGAAAIVGDTVVPLAQIQQDLNALISAHPTEAAQAQQHKQLGQVSRQLLGTQIRHLLLAQQRKTDHLGYSHAQFDQLLRSYQQQNNGGKPLSGVEEQQARTAITDQLLQVDLAKKKLAGLSLDADVVLADSRADALAKSKQIAAHPGSVTTLIRQSSGASNHYT